MPIRPALALLVVLLVGCGEQVRVGAVARERLAAVPMQREPHRARLLETGEAALLARIAAIRAAQDRIVLQTFIWSGDACGRLLYWELLQAARRGVQVRVLVDALFLHRDVDELARALQAGPLELRVHHPLGRALDPPLAVALGHGLVDLPRLNRRMHTKVMVVDGQTLLIGGRNVEDCYFDRAAGLNFRDRDLLLEGPVAAQAEAAFETHWRSAHVLDVRDLRDVRSALAALPPELPAPTAEALDIDRLLADCELALAQAQPELQPLAAVGFWSDRPGKPLSGAGAQHAVAEHLVDLLGSAEHEVLIQSPYLVLSPRAVAQFAALRQARPQLRLLVSTNSLAATDNWPTYALSYQQKRVSIQRLGMDIREFMPHPAQIATLWPSFPERLAAAESSSEDTALRLCLHAKTLVVDRRWVVIGSYNLDPRSANLNTEAVLVIDDPGFASQVAALIERDAAPANSWVVAPRQHPLPVSAVVHLMEAVSALGARITRIDLWPHASTSSYALRPGAEPVDPDDSDFHQHYEAVGHFPGLPPGESKRILARLFKALGSGLAPIL